MSLINEKVSFYIIKIWSFEQYFKCWPGYLSNTLKPYSKNTMYICWYSLHNDEEIHGQPVLHNTDLFYAIVKVSIFNQHIICQWTWRITVWYTLSKLTLAAYFLFIFKKAEQKYQMRAISWMSLSTPKIYDHLWTGWAGTKDVPYVQYHAYK